METKADDGYKLIEAEVADQITKIIPDAVVEISSKFSKEDIVVRYNGEIISVELKALDLRAFRSVVNQISSRHSISDDINPLKQIVEKIERIGSYGIKGRKRLFVGYNKERKVADRLDKVRRRGMYYYAQSHNFNTKNNEVPDEYSNRITCGDSENVLKKLPDNCIDLIFTSPPYNFGLDYDTEEDGVHWDKYFSKLFSVFQECIRVLKYGGRIIVNIQPLFSDYIPSHHIVSNFFIENKLIWKAEIVWEKHNYNCKYTAWGSWKSPSSPYLKYTWEFLEVFAKGTLTKKGRREDIDITADEFKKWVMAEWSIAPERNMKKYGHPAMFPEELATRVIKLFSYKNDVVLDPFNGVGTTTLVAHKLGRMYLGIDTSTEYCEKAIQRISEHSSQMSLL